MNDEQAFLDAIAANPADPTPRLVFADWLQDREDCRAERYRLEGRIVADPTGWDINFCSGGIGSYITGKRVGERRGTAKLIHLFTDTKSEDADLYRFLRESVALTGGTLLTLADGRDLWELFNAQGMIANTRADICSRILKRDIARAWINGQFKPGAATLYFGIDHTETRRCDAISRNWHPFGVTFPLCEWGPMTKCDMLKECERDGIDPPRIYDEGFPHNNCAGFCVKAGHAQFAHLLKARPEVFAYHAQKEQEFRERTGKDVAVMRDRRGGTVKPLPMLEFQRQVESGEREVDRRDWGKGCQCFIDFDDV